MISLKSKQNGFTIVELLIVIVVIGILAAIVITTFTGVQKKARDSERKSDIQSLSSQAEVFYAENTKYPTATQLAAVEGLKDEALDDPSVPAGTGLTSTAPTSTTAAPGAYAYVLTPSGCDNTTTDCTGFTLTAQLEANDTENFVVTGSNN